MAIKKENKTLDQETAPITSDPNLEEKRQQFQRAAESNKPMSALVVSAKHHTPRKRTLIIIVGALLVLLGSALVAYTYFFWQNSPEKIVADALTNAASSRSATYTSTIKSKNAPIAQIKGRYTDGKSEMNGVITTSLPGSLGKIDASAVVTQRDVYLKVSDATELVKQTAPESQQHIFAIILSMLQKQIDNKWIQMATSDLVILEPATKVSGCSADGIKQLTTSQPLRMAVIRTYLDNPFLTIVESGTQGMIGTYQISIERSILDKFLDAVQTTDATKALVAGCDAEISKLKNGNISNVRVELVIDKISRTISQADISLSGKSPLDVSITPLFNQSVTVKEPTADVKFRDIESRLYGAYTGLQPN